MAPVFATAEVCRAGLRVGPGEYADTAFLAFRVGTVDVEDGDVKAAMKTRLRLRAGDLELS